MHATRVVPKLIPAAPESLALTRARQILRFLKAFADRRIPTVRQTAEQSWSLYLRDLPSHSSISIGEVELTTAADVAVAEAAPNDRALLSIRRPNVTECPSPPVDILPWLEDGWKRVDSAAVVRATRNEARADGTTVVKFDEDSTRVPAFEAWQTKRAQWVENERPARDALQRFEDLYSLRSRLQTESERIELVLGDGRLRWELPEGTVDHPILLQRVDIQFLSEGPEIRVVDADRAPELATTLLQAASALTPGVLGKLREELEARGYHPLERAATNSFLTRVVQQLHARGEFEPKAVLRVSRPEPHLSRDPVLFVRTRQAGFSAAFERILEDLEQEGSSVPVSVSLLTGVDRQPDSLAESDQSSPWSEPSDVLLSKPANEQQIQIARALDRYSAVLVQGPPGTGKSHTIANLIGHLVAKGLRVLVTSQTTKALRVLRSHVVPSLQPLCVAVLESDLDSRRQMEGAIRGILGRLTESTPAQLERDVADLAEERFRMLGEIERCTVELRMVREGEYSEVQVAGESKAPADAARWVADAGPGNNWIPGPLTAQAPLPIGESELQELYASNGALPPEDEAELADPLPDLALLPGIEAFEALVRTGRGSPPPSDDRWWARPAAEAELPVLSALLQHADAMARELTHFTAWQIALVSAGHEGTAAAALWTDLAELVQEGHALWERTRPVLLEHDCRIAVSFESAKAEKIAEELRVHIANGGGLGGMALLFKSDWKGFLSGSSVNGGPPTTAAHFTALRESSTLQIQRDRVNRRWARQAVPVGLPDAKTVPVPAEPILRDYVGQFPLLLEWWNTQRRTLDDRLQLAGFDWRGFRNHHVAASGPTKPFDRDAQLVSETLLSEVRSRAARAWHLKAARELAQLGDLLAPYRGRVCRRLAKAVSAGDIESYGGALLEFRRLLGLQALAARRQDLLIRLEKCAPRWVAAFRNRTSPHDTANAPGDAQIAWRWRQYADELERRVQLDERVLMERLHQLQAELRGVTADLIDRRAWLGQVRRIDLASRQALQGWTDIQRKIGKGTGKRVPELQAEARRLLAKARNAVPVWIMPLNRVADSLDLSQGRFDVVIVDEASQSDVMGLLGWFLGERICVVGDHEQVSPLAVGQKLDEISALISDHLDGIPNALLYDGKTSIYDLARRSFGATIALREHFRCVPDIIDFSNHLSYDGEILPLRDPTRVQRPHVVEFPAPTLFGALQSGKTNLAEARSIAALLKASIALPAYEGKSFGAITLLGDEQAGLIQTLALELVGAVDLDARRFIAGNAAQFQGDERDVIFLSMVHAPTGGILRMTQDEPTKQRYNVAASRARDQLWLIHSLDPSRDLQQGDLRRRLIEHVRNPGAMREKIIAAERKAESPFELEVIRRLIGAGYEVWPQVWVGRYRIDMVVRGGGQQVAVECDGDRFHGFDQIPADMARQAVLERVGWRFARIRGTRFYRHPDEAMAELLARLNELGVKPDGLPSASSSPVGLSPAMESLFRDAWQIAREQNWIAAIESSETATDGVQ